MTPDTACFAKEKVKARFGCKVELALIKRDILGSQSL
jgi:hypothetical protein